MAPVLNGRVFYSTFEVRGSRFAVRGSRFAVRAALKNRAGGFTIRVRRPDREQPHSTRPRWPLAHGRPFAHSTPCPERASASGESNARVSGLKPPSQFAVRPLRFATRDSRLAVRGSRFAARDP